MVKKLLVANRGEIAVRIVRACAELGITSVAIYTDADCYALHVKKADEAYNIGPESIAAYLNAHRIVNLAVSTGCDAIHPGYGFLSENPLLADICQRRGVIFIGPSADVIRMMGDKTQARQAMQKAGLPIVPGSEGNLADLDAALALAEKIGYPVMLKATNGGGGRGIRRCDDWQALQTNFERVRSEAEKAFGRADIYMEKCILNPKHLEVQILADQHEHVVHLFERDCSIQRRNQKLIEIAPSPQLDAQQKQQLAQWGVQAAKAVGYENAGTIEFLLDENDQFYFMEMNTRLQVEHTVTEQITGIDIVQEQIKIASGAPLGFTQAQIQQRGYAIQFRINAEDPQNDFLPSFGKITQYYSPGGPGTRTDAAIYTGYKIPPDYDSLCAKLTVWDLTWPGVIARGLRALHEMRLYGVKTTMPFFIEILQQADFKAAKFNTSFIEDHPDLLHYTNRVSPATLAAVVSAVIAVHLGT